MLKNNRTKPILSILQDNLMPKKTWIMLIMVLTLSAFVTQVASAAPPFPFELFGEIVDQDGNNVPLSTEIDCVVAGVTASATLYTDSGQSFYYCQILGDDPDTADTVEGGTPSDQVTIEYNGSVIGQTAWKSGETQVDVAVNLNGTNPTPEPTVTPTVVVGTPTPTASPTPVGTPVATPTPGGGGSGQTAEPDLVGLQTAFVGQTIGVELLMTDMVGVGVYGVSADCSVAQSGTVRIAYAQFGGLFPDSALPGIDELDFGSNSWQGAKSQKNPQPALNNDGLFATLYLDAFNTGTAELICMIRTVDRNGFDIANQTVNHFLTIQQSGAGDLNVTANYQARLDHSDIYVVLSGPTGRAATTNSDGHVSFSGLAFGAYDIDAGATGYLSTCAQETLGASGVTVSNPLLLWAGDTNDSGVVDIIDAIAVSSNFDRPANGSLAIDFNADGRTDIADLAALGGNFGKVTNCN